MPTGLWPARLAVDTYARQEDPEPLVTLLTALMLLCDLDRVRGGDFETALATARERYDAEAPDRV